jgi:hypothetical protein
VAIPDQINCRPWFEQNTVPCDGEVGDILVITPLKENQADPELQGSATVWFCIKAGMGERPAVWARVQFDGVASCDTGPLPTPPQVRPTLRRG